MEEVSLTRLSNVAAVRRKGDEDLGADSPDERDDVTDHRAGIHLVHLAIPAVEEPHALHPENLCRGALLTFPRPADRLRRRPLR